ncbi:BatD family protein [Alteromonas flava]|uniref:BatD family protein n=1 Tax=Alteromonas flava TaxID=2048003 RepID=UPI000C282198|nr:BatD family protein [Alteromonas flava]
MFQRYIVTLLSLCMSFFVTLANADVTGVTAQIDKNPVMLDESFTLSITADGDVDRNAFDASVLLNDFVVGQTSVSSQTRMVNFETSRSTTWNVILFPRAVGNYTIPALTVAGATTDPIELAVIPVSNNNDQEMRDIFVTTALDNQEVYIHQQLIYTVKLYLAKDIERGSLQAPELVDADIRQIGKDAEYSEIVNGKRYRVIERTFAIIPQKSGSYSINGPVFQGEVIANTRQSFGFFNRTQTVNRVGPAQELTVLPVPDDIQGVFLPSEFVDISEEWSSDIAEWTVGEPITRTLTLTAVGLTDAILPEIDDRYPPAIKTYPDQANSTSAENAQSIVAQRVESIALIPSKPGSFVLLPVEVEWFNILTKQIETAVIPARTIQVKAAASNSTAAPLSPPPSSASNTVESSLSVQPDTPNQTGPALSSNRYPQPIFEWRWNNGWMWTTVLLVLVSCGLLWSRSSDKVAQPVAHKAKPSQREKECWQALHGALKQNNKTFIRRTLHDWLEVLAGRSFTSLAQALTWIDSRELQQLVDEMQQAEFAQNPKRWDGRALNQQLKSLRQLKLTQSSQEKPLPGLYPT